MTPIPFPATDLRQRHFWQRVGPRLLALPWLTALWLGGSLARGDADRWSSVDLHLLLGQNVDPSSVQNQLCALLDDLFPRDWTLLRSDNGETVAALHGLTHAELSTAINQGSVLFCLCWTTPEHLAAHLAGQGATHLLWASADLSAAARTLLHTPAAPLRAGNPAAVQTGLIGFWHALALLPAALNREEHLAASLLLGRCRAALTELVIALNGAAQPPSAARINPYLGPAQREAFEKSLRQSATLGESWIGQAVALIVLYRWYAPQLAEMYTIDYPASLERSVLALLSAEIPGWPARIATA